MVTSDCQQRDIIRDILSCFYIKKKWCKNASKWNQSFKALSFTAVGYTVNHSLKIFVSVSSEFLMNRLIHCLNQTGLTGHLWQGMKMTIRTLLQRIKNTLRSSSFNLLVRLKCKIKKPYLSLSPPVQIVLCCTDNWGRSPLAHLAWGQQGHVCRPFPLESTVTCHLWEWTPQHLYLLTKWSVCVYTLPLDCRVAGLAGVYSLSIKNPDGQNTKKQGVGEVGRVNAVGCGLHTVAGFFHCGISTVPDWQNIAVCQQNQKKSILVFFYVFISAVRS